MSTEAEGSVPAPQTTENNDVKTEKKEQAQPQKPKEQQQAALVGEKKLSGAELKKKAKEEKAARRAQAKASQASQGPSQGGQQASGDGKEAKQSLSRTDSISTSNMAAQNSLFDQRQRRLWLRTTSLRYQTALATSLWLGG
ncbi:hypothetical protein NW765_005252 [Fusarium oxysporum]|nr:hypothetical protein NW765_005252 [Fusarium oxysporum]